MRQDPDSVGEPDQHIRRISSLLLSPGMIDATLFPLTTI